MPGRGAAVLKPGIEFVRECRLSRVKRIALPEPHSGLRIQPTAQAVGLGGKCRRSEAAKEEFAYRHLSARENQLKIRNPL